MNKLIALLLLILTTSTASSSVVFNSKSEDIESFNALYDKLETAVASRDFMEARSVLESLMPIMKDEIRNSKKELSSMKKDGASVQSIEEFTDRYMKQSEIYESIDHLMEVSSAALRVKANVIVAQADTFRSLILQ